jgi:hypothetical protein
MTTACSDWFRNSIGESHGFYEHLIVRGATIDELLSDDFERLPGQKGDTDLAARRLAAWCRSCASGDWSLFNRRWSATDWRWLRCWKDLPPFAANLLLQRRLGSTMRAGSRRRCRAPVRRPSGVLRSAGRVRASARAVGRSGGGEALSGDRCPRARQPDRIRPRRPAPFVPRGAVRFLRRGALQTLRQTTQDWRKAGRCRRAATKRRDVAVLGLSPT